jgi:hypothetical protein
MMRGTPKISPVSGVASNELPSSSDLLAELGDIFSVELPIVSNTSALAAWHFAGLVYTLHCMPIFHIALR